MRAGIGLVGLLVGVGLLLLMYSMFAIPSAREGKKAQDQAQQIAGYGEDAIPATESFAATGQMRGARLTSLQVTAVTPGGAMDTFYGLKPGDEITAVGGMSLDALANHDEELAKALVVSEGFQKKQPLTVRRGGQTFFLPSPAGAAAVAPAPGAPPTPAQPAPAAPRKPGGLEGQLQDIQNAAGGGQTQDE